MKMSMNRRFLVWGIIILLGVVTGFFIGKTGKLHFPVSNGSLPHSATVFAPETAFEVRVADSESEREIGLSGSPSLRDNEGMLFVFPTDGQYGFWMKEMKFPIDIVWIDANMQVVDIVAHAEPASYPDVFMPRASALYVLEISAGAADRAGITIGTIIKVAPKNLSEI